LTFAYTAAAESELTPTDSSDRRFICDWAQCGKVFSHPDSLRVHHRRHTDEKPHHCHHCEAAYRQKSGLKYHLEKVHGEKTIGRCGRKRKLATDQSNILKCSSDNHLPSSSPLVSVHLSSRSAELLSEVESGRRPLSDMDTVDSLTVDPKHAAALSKVRELSVNMTDLQTKQFSKSIDTHSIVKGRRWSLAESLSQDCDDDNLDNIDINDEWLLDEEDGFISNTRKPTEAGVTAAVEEGDRDHAGSTSDTEPLDEDLCEELRKLSDAINSEVLSPRGLDNISSPFDSSVGAASKSDSIGNILRDMSSSSHPALYQGIDGPGQQSEVFDQFSSTLGRDSNVNNDFYPDVAVTSVSTSSMLTRGQYSSGSSDQADMVNGYLADGYSCPEVHPAHFHRNTSTSESIGHLPVDVPEVMEPLSYRSVPFDGSVHPWSGAVSSARWSSQSDENMAFLPARGISSGAVSRFNSQVRCDEAMYSNLMSTWPPAGNGHHWFGHDGLIPSSWSQRHLAIARGQSDLTRQHEWHMGRQGESAFSRSGSAFSGRVGFEAGRQTSPKPCMPYRADMTEMPSISDHFMGGSFVEKHGAPYPAAGVGHVGSWSDLYSRSSHMAGVGNSDYNFPRNVYGSPVQSERFCTTSGYSGVQLHAGYEHGVETDGSRNAAYRIPPVHAPSWPVPGLSDPRESLRPTPEAQQSSMLYNVVPQYY